MAMKHKKLGGGKKLKVMGAGLGTSGEAMGKHEGKKGGKGGSKR